MARSTEKRRGIRLGGAAAALAIAGALALSGIATAGPDQLKGGSVAIQLKNARGLKLKPKSLNLPITAGSVDPIDGSGTVNVSGTFKAKRGKGKTKVTITTLNLAPNGGQGSVSAKIGKKKVAVFGTLTGGSVARNGWGATISNIRATIAGKGAQALNKAFSPGNSGGAKKSAAGGVKAGQPLGTVVSVTTNPLSVEVVPNSGTLTLHTDLGGAFASKLADHCISPLTGVTPIQPATQSLADFSFPVSGGSAAPDFTAGELLTAGGQTLTKGNGPPVACTSASPPVGTKLVSTEPGVNFAQNTLQSTATLPDGFTTRSSLATIDFSTGTRSVDAGTKQLTVSNATVNLSYPSALTLNTLFPNVGSPSDDFAAGDEIGTIDLTAKLR